MSTANSQLNVSQDDALTEIYFNGIQIGLSLSDMHMILSTDGLAKCKLRMSFTTAKTLSVQIANAVAEFERLAEHEIMTMADVEARVVKRIRENE